MAVKVPSDYKMLLYFPWRIWGLATPWLPKPDGLGPDRVKGYEFQAPFNLHFLEC